MKSIKIGDRVKITAIIAGLKHRKNKNGVITRVNGSYYYVRPTWCKWKVELYDNEFVKLS
jgi:hypothetical protein